MTFQNNFENRLFNRDVNIISNQNFPTDYHLHWHKYAEILYLPASANIVVQPKITVNQVEYLMTPGDIVFIWSGELHQIEDNDDKQLLGLQFSSTLLNELPDFAPYTNHFRYFHHLSMDENKILVQKMTSHIEQILSLPYSDLPFYGVETVITLYRLFMDFALAIKSSFISEDDLPHAESNKTFQKISLACRYIQENCEQDLALSDVSEYLGFSTYYFSRVFKQITACSFVDYLTTQRVKLAQSLLANSALSVTEIAYQSGFNSIATFNRAFRKCRGCSPSEYRKYYSK